MSDARPVALTIAGSDSGGGAGIQADLKTFTALGVFGTSAITAITAQNTVGVHAVRELPPDVIQAQIRAVLDDLQPAAIKTGMLSRAVTIEAVAEELRVLDNPKYVMDPVMVSETGHALLDPAAIAILAESLMPIAMLVTPNVSEAEALTGVTVSSVESQREAAQRLVDRGAKAALVKGGHIDSADAIDVLFDGDAFTEFSAPRVESRNTHGTGCTYAAAITAELARGQGLTEAIDAAKRYVTGAIARGLDLGSGPGPVDHMWRLS